MSDRNHAMLATLLLTGILLGGLGSAAHATSLCGPGPHWVDTCAAGTDTFASEAVIQIDTPAGGSETLNLTGPTSVQRSNPRDDSIQFPGLRPVDGHLDVIDTEIVSMTLTGISPSLGPVTLELRAGSFSLGAISEEVGVPNLADSFFDVFVDLTAGGQVVHNNTPVRVHAVIDRVVPFGIDYLWQGSIRLFDENDDPTGFVLKSVAHQAVPEPTTALLLACGLVGLGVRRRLH